MVNDPANTVKARRATAKTAPAEPPPASTSPLGVVSDSPRAPATLVGSFVAGHTSDEGYVRTSKAAYRSFYPRGCQQPTTQLLWNRGQLVHRRYFEEHGGEAAPATPLEAVPVNSPGGGLPAHVSGLPTRT